MPNLNKCQFMGHLGRDPEIRYTADGTAACNFSIAVTRKWKSKDGEKKEDTQWVTVSAFGRQAEIVGEYLKKGSPVYVEGWLRNRKWQDKEGNDRYSTEIVMENMQMLGGKKDGEERPAKPTKPAEPPSVEDDDIPF